MFWNIKTNDHDFTNVQPLDVFYTNSSIKQIERFLLQFANYISRTIQMSTEDH